MKLREIILAWLLAGLSVFGQGNQTALPANQPSGTNSQAANNQNPTGSFITVNASGNSFASNTVPQTNSNNLDELRVQESIANATWWQVKIAFALIVVAAAQFWIYRRQAKIMGEQATIAGEQSKILKSQFKDSRRTQRANISIEAKALPDKKESIIYPDSTNGNKFQLSIVMKNSGPTPATDVVFIGGEIGVFDYGLEHWYGIDSLKKAKHTSVATLSPRQERYLIIGEFKPITAGEIQYIDDYIHPWKRIYAYGRVEYKDVFGIDRFTNFCFVFWPTTKGKYTPLIAEKGNETDHQEERENQAQPEE